MMYRKSAFRVYLNAASLKPGVLQVVHMPLNRPFRVYLNAASLKPSLMSPSSSSTDTIFPRLFERGLIEAPTACLLAWFQILPFRVYLNAASLKPS